MNAVFATIFVSIFYSILPVAIAKPVTDLKDLQIQAECSLYRADDGKLIRNFSIFSLCLFFEDGSMIVVTSTPELHRFDRNMNLVWKVPLANPHHHIEFSKINNEIVVLTTKRKTLRGRNFQIDTIHAFDLNGKQKKFFDPSEDINGFTRKINYPLHKIKKEPNLSLMADYELLHSNAIHEIPHNSAEKANGAFKAGNYILTVSSPPRVLVIDSELKNILWKKEFPERGVHDATINENGEMLVYLNYPNPKSQGHYSEVRKYNLVNGKEIIKIEKLPERRFLSDGCGSVAELPDGGMMFTEIGEWREKEKYKGLVHHFDPKGKFLKTIRLSPIMGSDTVCVHRIEVGSFRRFLELNKGL